MPRITSGYLQRQEQRQATYAVLLNAVAQRVMRVLDMDRLLPEIVTAIRDSFDYHNVALYLVEGDGDKAVLRAVAGAYASEVPSGHYLPLGIGLIGTAASTGETQWSNDVCHDERFVCGFPAAQNTRSEIAVPLLHGEAVIGVLDVQSTELNAFDKTDVMALETLSGQLVSALVNARLYEQVRRQNQQLEALRRISLDIAAQLDVPQALHTIVEQVAHLLQASAGTVWLCDWERRQITLAACWGMRHCYEEEAVIVPIGVGVAGQVVRDNRPLAVADYSSWGERMTIFDPEEFTASAGVPLRVGDEVIGALTVDDRAPGRAFTKEDLWLLEQLAPPAAIAIQNARLYRQATESKQFNESIVNSITEGVLLVDDEGIITFANSRMMDLSGIPVGELKGRSWLELVVPAQRGQAAEAFRQATLGAAGLRELQMLRRDNEPWPAQVDFVPRFTGGGYAGSLILLTDITERKLWEAEFRQMHASLMETNARLKESLERLQQTQRQLIQAEKLSAIGQLISGVAHELNNPLTTIAGYAQILQMADVGSDVKADLEKIYQEAMRCVRIVKNLLTFARQHKPEQRLVNVNEVLERTLALRAYHLRVQNIVVDKDLDPNLPLTLADPHQLQQVFLNLIVNAEQAMLSAHGRGHLKIITQTAGPDRIWIIFRDDGPGIPAEIMGRLFDPFFTTKEDGTGLGLSICYGIVQEHGGRIWAESQVGQGATFFVELPVQIDEKVKERPESYLPSVRGGEELRVLVVDDEQPVLDIITRILRHQGHQVTQALSGQEAMRRLEEGNYNVIVSDLRMPGLSGQDLYNMVRERWPHLAHRIVFTTGDTLSPETVAFLQKTGNLCLGKPFKLDELVETIAKAAEIHR